MTLYKHCMPTHSQVQKYTKHKCSRYILDLGTLNMLCYNCMLVAYFSVFSVVEQDLAGQCVDLRVDGQTSAYLGQRSAYLCVLSVVEQDLAGQCVDLRVDGQRRDLEQQVQQFCLSAYHVGALDRKQLQGL